jgi:hypothetical protein
MVKEVSRESKIEREEWERESVRELKRDGKTNVIY